MKKKLILIISIISIIIITLIAVFLTNSESETCDGYTLYSSDGSVLKKHSATLIDMDGNIIKEWEIAGSPVKMLPSGSIIGTKNSRNSYFKTSGHHDTIELVQLDWDGNEEWSFSNWDDANTGIMMSRQHHDYQREGNPVGYFSPCSDEIQQGNTLILSHLDKTIPEISERKLLDDVIYEVNWQGDLTGFEWHGTDHINEMGFNETELEAINKTGGDWLHINSMSRLGENIHDDSRFDPKNIIISSREANFIAIIDHETGDIVWKVGPDFNEGPEKDLKQFIGQHHAHMIPKGLPGEGNILVFDNGGESGYGGDNLIQKYTRDYSRIVEFNPVTFEKVWQYKEEGFYSTFISSAQRLPNGNTLIDEGEKGRIFEVNINNEIVWEYNAPKVDGEAYIYRAYRIPPEWIPENTYENWEDIYSFTC